MCVNSSPVFYSFICFHTVSTAGSPDPAISLFAPACLPPEAPAAGGSTFMTVQLRVGALGIFTFCLQKAHPDLFHSRVSPPPPLLPLSHNLYIYVTPDQKISNHTWVFSRYRQFSLTRIRFDCHFFPEQPCYIVDHLPGLGAREFCRVS